MKQDQIKELCGDIILHSKKVADVASEKKEDIVAKACYSFANRTRANIEAIQILFPAYAINKELELSIGILLRNNLLDHLTILYLVDKREGYLINFKKGQMKTDDVKRDIEKDFLLLLYDHLNNSLNFFETEERVRIRPQGDGEKVIEKLIKNRKLDVDIKTIKESKFPSPTKMFVQICSNGRHKDFAIIANNQYNYYSKYEHYGYLSDELVSLAKDQRQLKFALLLCLDTIKYLAIILNKKELSEEIEKRFEHYAEQI